MAEKQSPKGTVTFRTPVKVSDAGLVYVEIRPHLDQTKIGEKGKPTLVERGVYRGYSLPTYAADEELFFEICVPDRYDEASDITVHVVCYLDTANTDKKFKLQASWYHLTPGTDIVPDTTPIHDVEVETDTGEAAQYRSFLVEFTLDYDADTPDNVIINDLLGIRLRRIASSDEIAGEVVISHLGVIFRRDKLGTAAP